VLRPFAPLSATLSAAQRRQIAAFAATLSPADVVTCVGGAGSGPVRLLRDVARLRATTVCNALAQRVPGVKTTIDIALSGEIQIADQAQQSSSQAATQAAAPAQQSAATPPQSPAPIRVSASDLSRRVLVVARPAGLAPRRS